MIIDIYSTVLFDHGKEQPRSQKFQFEDYSLRIRGWSVDDRRSRWGWVQTAGEVTVPYVHRDGIDLMKHLPFVCLLIYWRDTLSSAMVTWLVFGLMLVHVICESCCNTLHAPRVGHGVIRLLRIPSVPHFPTFHPFPFYQNSPTSFPDRMS